MGRKRTDVRAQSAKVAQVKRQVGQVALAQFQNRNLDTAAQLFLTSDTDDFLSQISTVEKVSENQNTVLQDFQEKQAELAGLERSAATRPRRRSSGRSRQLADLRAESSVDKSPSQRWCWPGSPRRSGQRIAAEEKAADEARAKAEAAEKARQARAPRARAPPAPRPTQPQWTAAVSGSRRGAKAFAFAKSQLGKPYRYAAAGPRRVRLFRADLGAAWRRRGVSLPRTSQTQVGSARTGRAGRSKPGDLVFYYSGITHVGLYSAAGRSSTRRTPAQSVEYSQIVDYDAVRPAARPGDRGRPWPPPVRPRLRPPASRPLGGALRRVALLLCRLRRRDPPLRRPRGPDRHRVAATPGGGAIRLVEAWCAPAKGRCRAGLRRPGWHRGPRICRAGPAAVRQPVAVRAGRPHLASPARAHRREAVTAAGRAVLGQVPGRSGLSRQLAARRGDRDRAHDLWLTFPPTGWPAPVRRSPRGRSPATRRRAPPLSVLVDRSGGTRHGAAPA